MPWGMQVLLLSLTFVDTKYADNAPNAHTARIMPTDAITTRLCRLDSEHCVHVNARDGEYPFLHTAQSAYDTPENRVSERAYV